MQPVSSQEWLAGTGYAYSVTDANNCTPAAGTFSVVQPVAVSATFSSINVTCFGSTDGSITVNGSGGTGPYSYRIDGGGFVSGTPGTTFNNLSVGNHNLEVRDAGGCSYLFAVNITQPALVTATVGGVTNVSCFGQANGSVTITAGGGITPYTYSLDGSPVFVAGNTFNNLSTGTHNVTVKDANGCTAGTSVNITQPSQLTGSIGSQTNASCTGQPTGTVTVMGGGGVAPYSYAIDGGTAQAIGQLYRTCSGQP